MANYQLTITMDDASVARTVQANQYITIVKNVQSALPVAWLTFLAQPSNTVSWNEKYNIYESRTELQDSAVIKQMAVAQDVQEGFLYTFENNVFTGSKDSSIKPYYGVLNNSGVNDLNQIFGLAQAATVQNTQMSASPLSASIVFNQETLTIDALESVSVYLSSYEDNGTVISHVQSNACVVLLDNNTPTANLGFNSDNNAFVLAPLTP